MQAAAAADDSVIVHKLSKNLTRDERRAVYEYLIQQRKPGSDQLQQGAFKEACDIFGCSKSTVYRLWWQAQNSLAAGNVIVAALSPLKKGRCGQKKIELNADAVREIPLSRRQSMRSLASALNVPLTRVFRRLKEGKLRRHSSNVKPLLTDSNKQQRVWFCLSKIDPISIEMREHKFRDFFDMVYIDEKWFYMTRIKNNYYLLPDEAWPWSCNSG